ncbi:MAG: M13 family metallopeptidase [Brumimicrobium sp.]|nr:M13 family metallopeptidase [Brumimicrobium sp.]
MKFLNLSIIFLALLIVQACGSSSEVSSDSAVKESGGKYSVQVDYLDKTVRPQDDFFQFANGTWIKNNPIPPSESRWGSFNELDKANKVKLTVILEEAKIANAPKGSDLQIIGDYYSAMSDMTKRNEVSQAKINSIVEEVNKITSKEELAAYTAKLHSKGISAFYGFYVGQDLKNVEQNIPYFSQGGLGLPNRDYYFDESKLEIRKQYEKYIIKSFNRAKVKNPVDVARKVIEFETKMAKNMMKPAELRVPENTYNPTQRYTFMKMLSNWNTEDYLTNIKVESFDTIVVGQTMYLEYLNDLIGGAPLEIIKSYLLWKNLDHYAPYLDQSMVDLHFAFYGTALSGKTEMKPMNEQAIEEMTGKAVKTALAKEFVARHFSEEAKVTVNTMVDNLLKVYCERIQNLEWMTAKTKKEALIKLEAIGRKLGYPDEWKDLENLNIVADNYLHNVDECARFSFQENIAKLNKPVDKKEWGMPAHMVNAYYHPLLNEIAFPAGIMQPPFFDVNAEDAVNYGAIGMVIGHEFTHGFDDMGSKFAADGSFTNWWSEEDRLNFEKRTEKLGKTFSGFCPIEGHCVNPDLTMGENIADLGGITMAYHAYAMTEEFKKGEVVNGFTPAQRFFIAYAQLWKINYTEAELKKRIATDPHSPGMYRVNGPLMNCPEFFKAFDVKVGDPMRNSEETISKIW